MAGKVNPVFQQPNIWLEESGWRLKKEPAMSMAAGVAGAGRKKTGRKHGPFENTTQVCKLSNSQVWDPR